MGYRDTAGGRHGNGGGDPADHLKGNSVFPQNQSLLASSAEHKGISPLQPDDSAPFFSFLHQNLVDLLLRFRVRASPLSHINLFCPLGNPSENPVPYQGVIDNRLGLFQNLPASEGQESCVAWPGSYQPYLSTVYRSLGLPFVLFFFLHIHLSLFLSVLSLFELSFICIFLPLTLLAHTVHTFSCSISDLSLSARLRPSSAGP